MAVGRCLIGGLCMLLLAYAGIVSTSESEQQLRKLTDQNFEHDTQAATGQTTGHWLVLFTKKDSAASKEAREAVIKTKLEFDGQPIVAEVDIEDSPKTAKRFGVQEVPELRLFRDRSVVQYAGTWDVEDIQLFIQEGWKALPKNVVPKEATFADQALVYLNQFRNEAQQFFNRFPMTLALLAGIVAYGAYALTKRFLPSKGRRSGQRRRRPPINVQKRSKVQ